MKVIKATKPKYIENQYPNNLTHWVVIGNTFEGTGSCRSEIADVFIRSNSKGMVGLGLRFWDTKRSKHTAPISIPIDCFSEQVYDLMESIASRYKCVIEPFSYAKFRNSAFY